MQEKSFIEKYGTEPVAPEEIQEYKISDSDLNYFINLWEKAQELEAKYNSNITDRKKIIIELKEIYSKLNSISGLFSEKFKGIKNSYKSKEEQNNIIYCDYNILFNIILKLVNSKDEFVLTNVSYTTLGENFEHLMIVNKKIIKENRFTKIKSYYDFMKELENLIDNNQSFIIGNKQYISHYNYCGKDINFHKFHTYDFSCHDENTKPSHISIRYYDTGNQELFMGIKKLLSFIEQYGKDLTNISQDDLLNIIEKKKTYTKREK